MHTTNACICFKCNGNVLRGLSFSISNDLKSERTTESYMSCPFFV